MRFFKCLSITSLVMHAATGFAFAASIPIGTPTQVAVIQLADGSYAAGKLLDSSSGDLLDWQSPAFVSPFKFPIKAISGVHFPIPPHIPSPVGEYCFELAGGDVVYGSLLSLTGEEALLDVPAIGQLHVAQSAVRRIVRWRDSGEQLFLGPSGLQGWKATGTTSRPWREEVGHLISNEKGAVLFRNFDVPAQACFEFEIAWGEDADFELAIGVTDNSKTALRAFRFEIWEKQFVAQRETEREADVAALADVKGGVGRIHLKAYLDQQKGRLLVFSADGRQLADLTATTAKPAIYGGLQLKNRAGEIRLERLRVSRWNGEPPVAIERDKARIHSSDGTITYGHVTSYDAAAHEFTIESDGNEQRIADSRVQEIVLSEKDYSAAHSSLGAVLLSGARISGELQQIEAGKLSVKCPGIRETVSFPLSDLQTLVVLRPADAPDKTVDDKSNAPTNSAVRRGRLETEGTSLQGNLVDAKEGEQSCLAWQPTGSSVASPIARGISARIVYRDPPPPPTPQTVNRNGRLQVAIAGNGAAVIGKPAAPVGIIGQLQSIFANGVKPEDKGKPSLGLAVVHLRSGDTIRANVTGIDEKGLLFESDITEATFIPHAQLKAVELMPNVAAATIAKSKKERLLTLPRMQRDNPPTQLIRSINGDYLRGRIVSMNDKELQVEIRLEIKAVPRASVARIIWLHADETDPAATPPAEQPAATRVQSLPGDGHRLTFLAERLEGSNLSGHSPLLGVCHVDLKQTDQLLIGASIDQAAATLAFHQWKLKAAADPLEAAESSAGGEGDGLESALVGKPAPDFELELVEGKTFKLADRKNKKIVVLDFWASWCGPCLQAMPQVDKVTQEFADRDVELVAINLQEAPDRVKAALERLELKTTVALDRDGLVTEKYGATAIPQTVIIDRDGKVARLFVGGGPRFDEQLRAALESVLTPPAAPTEK